MPDPQPTVCYIHLNDGGYTACKIEPQWQVKSDKIEQVTCPKCLEAYVGWLRQPSGTHYADDDIKPMCGALLDVGTPLVIPGSGYTVTCKECLRLETAGRPAVILTHFLGAKDNAGYCGIEAEHTGGEGMLLVPDWGMVTCPACITIHSVEVGIDMNSNSTPVADEETPTAGPPSQDDVYAAHRHDWNMLDAYWEHDCDGCIFLGSIPGSGGYEDLYFCYQDHQRPTVIARHGEGSAYQSGMDFVDRIPALAVAYVRAQKAGLL